VVGFSDYRGHCVINSLVQSTAEGSQHESFADPLFHGVIGPVLGTLPSNFVNNLAHFHGNFRRDALFLSTLGKRFFIQAVSTVLAFLAATSVVLIAFIVLITALTPVPPVI